MNLSLERHFILLAISMLFQLNKIGSQNWETKFNKNCADPMTQFGSDCSCFAENTGFVGTGNTGWKPSRSRSACRKSCAEHPQCNYWKWGKHGGHCRFIKDWDYRVTYSRTDMDSGSKNCLLPEDKVGQRTTTTRPTVDCRWGQWGRWTSCTQTCGGGIQTSTRRKEKQSQNGGSNCVLWGSTTKTQPCKTNSCPGMTEFELN